MYDDILALREVSDDQQRGFLFEQILREILPWTSKPPIAVRTRTEQMDAFFEWSSWHFLVEAKAKKERITPGSADWEDYELKLRRRRGQCYGIYCTLFEVSDDITREAEDLNGNSCTNFLVTGSDWDQLAKHGIQFAEVCRYLVFHAKATRRARIADFEHLKLWLYNRSESEQVIGSQCDRNSSTFLRRHKLTRHSQVYVSRPLDETISEIAKTLTPSRLSNTEKVHASGDRSFTARREMPKQLCMLRDLSGSGKTTLSVQLALERERFFGMSKAALQPDIDALGDLLSGIGTEYGIRHLIAADRPLVYTIDSLDEAASTAGKRKEVISLLRLVEEDLTPVGRRHGLLTFPVLVLFTIRDDYWREWESYFEGRPFVTLRRKYSYFTPEETTIALRRYSGAYGFHVASQLDKKLQAVLAHPFNMQIFAESNEYRGEISGEDILDENVLSHYFEQKKQDILRRPVPGLTPELLMQICANAATIVVQQKSNLLTAVTLENLITTVSKSLEGYAANVATMIAAEQILVRDAEDPSKLRFRHTRFIEYLVAYYIALEISRTQEVGKLDELSSTIFHKDFVSLFHVHEFVRSVSQRYFPRVHESLVNYYSRSADYMGRFVALARSNIADGNRTSSLDLDVVCRSLDPKYPQLCWDAFFTIAAKLNKQPAATVLGTFDIAWHACAGRSDRWKLIHKLGQLRLLLSDNVLKHLLASDESADWYAFIDGIIDSDQISEFASSWLEVRGNQIETTMRRRPEPEWKRIAAMLHDLSCGIPYTRGELSNH